MVIILKYLFIYLKKMNSHSLLKKKLGYMSILLWRHCSAKLSISISTFTGVVSDSHYLSFLGSEKFFSQEFCARCSYAYALRS